MPKFDPIKVAQVERNDPSILRTESGAVMDHMALFRHLIAAGPRMHGTPGERKKKGS